MRIGMIGLGRMGSGLAGRLRRGGHEVVGYDTQAGARDVDSLSALATSLPPPRVAWLMVPAGDATERTIRELAALFGAGDVVVDGGNSNFRDSERHASELASRGIGFVDAGTSGGIWGAQEGFCLMVGGRPAHVEIVRPAFETLAPPGGFVHMGPPGTGHFTKMVHNGIEYGLMQAYAEGYELLRAQGIDARRAVEVWRHGSVVRSWLLDLLARALENDPQLDGVAGWADDSGEGRWTVEEAVRLAVPLPAISAALYARFASRQDESVAMKVVAALRNQFGGHAVKS